MPWLSRRCARPTTGRSRPNWPPCARSCGGWTAPAFVNIPATPQNLSAKALSGRYVQLKWDAVTVNYFGGPKYKVLRNGKVIATVTGGTSFTDRPRYAGTYRYQVRAIDPVRAKSALSSAVSVLVSN